MTEMGPLLWFSGNLISIPQFLDLWNNFTLIDDCDPSETERDWTWFSELYSARYYMQKQSRNRGWNREGRGNKCKPDAPPQGKDVAIHSWKPHGCVPCMVQTPSSWRSLWVACKAVSKFLAPEEKILPKSISFPGAPPLWIPRGAPFSLDGKTQLPKHNNHPALLWELQCLPGVSCPLPYTQRDGGILWCYFYLFYCFPVIEKTGLYDLFKENPTVLLIIIKIIIILSP